MDSLQRIRELEEQVRYQEMLSRISAHLINLPAAEVDDHIESALRSIVEFLGIDRSTFGEFSDSHKQLTITHSYAVPGVQPLPKVIATEIAPWMVRMLSQGKTVVFESLEDLPPESAQDKEYFERTGLKSNVTVPIFIAGAPLCAIAFGCLKQQRRWPDGLVQHLKSAGEMFGHAIYRKRAEQRIQHQLQFERFLSELSAEFVNISRDRLDHQIEAGLERLLEYFEMDRAALLKVSKDNRTATVTHSANGPGIKAAPIDINYAELFPWHTRKVLEPSVVSIHTKDLPEDASSDRRALESIDIRSNLVIPLVVQDSVDYVLAANNIHQERTWDDEILARIRLLGEIFVHALIRKKAEDELQALRSRLEVEAEYLRTEIKVAYHYDEIVGESRAIRGVLAKIEQVAASQSSVLIQGETGTGKELVARAIHSLSPRSKRAMVKVSCAALSSTLIENELFGREKGAYTGALTRQMGRFEVADGSTIFLDEVGELSLDLQTKLLRILQEGEFERLGSSTTLKVDVRVIAATNKNLAEAVKKGTFREDLYYRLNVFPIHVPPLRERPKDIPLLVKAFLKELRQKVGKNITAIPKETMENLIRYAWPGNIRELRNVVEHAMITSTGEVLQVHLPNEPPAASGVYRTLEETEKQHILDVLEKTGWVIKGPRGAAQILGLQPSTLYNKMKRLGIPNGGERRYARA